MLPHPSLLVVHLMMFRYSHYFRLEPLESVAAAYEALAVHAMSISSSLVRLPLLLTRVTHFLTLPPLAAYVASPVVHDMSISSSVLPHHYYPLLLLLLRYPLPSCSPWTRRQ